MNVCPAPLAFVIARALAWQGIELADALNKVWRRVAYATRYGHATLSEVLTLDQMALQDYLEALSGIVEEENRHSRS